MGQLRKGVDGRIMELLIFAVLWLLIFLLPEVERSIIMMSNGARISISDSNKDAFMQYLQKFSIQRKTQS